MSSDAHTEPMRLGDDCPGVVSVEGALNVLYTIDLFYLLARDIELDRVCKWQGREKSAEPPAKSAGRE